MTLPLDSPCVTLLVDIACPSCGKTRTLGKVGLGAYRCRDCGREFTAADLPAHQ